ncbi:hypothetical protein CEXT_407251 [Caerostris extrusa]|uniref:Uncharacterized protein n=1 Tax=Caerostris extrusa TaxID=172846 RepID=A0AAV4NMF1_CAEEX|nr:hypothetical protein CEXT_407251 [Caerostris extrusa]
MLCGRNISDNKAIAKMKYITTFIISPWLDSGGRHVMSSFNHEPTASSHGTVQEKRRKIKGDMHFLYSSATTLDLFGHESGVQDLCLKNGYCCKPDKRDTMVLLETAPTFHFSDESSIFGHQLDHPRIFYSCDFPVVDSGGCHVISSFNHQPTTSSYDTEHEKRPEDKGDIHFVYPLLLRRWIYLVSTANKLWCSSERVVAGLVSLMEAM